MLVVRRYIDATFVSYNAGKTIGSKLTPNPQQPIEKYGTFLAELKNKGAMPCAEPDVPCSNADSDANLSAPVPSPPLQRQCPQDQDQSVHEVWKNRYHAAL